MAATETKELPSAYSLFKPSFGELMENIWTFLPLFAILLGAAYVNNMTKGEMQSASAASLYVLALVVTFVVSPAIPYTMLQSAREKEVSFVDALRGGLPFVWRYLGLQILLAITIFFGFILFIVPGVFALQRLYLSPYCLIDQDMGIIEALKASAADAKEYSGAVWGLLGVTVLIILPAFTIILFPVTVVGVILYLCAPAVRYLQIQLAKQPHHSGKNQAGHRRKTSKQRAS